MPDAASALVASVRRRAMARTTSCRASSSWRVSPSIWASWARSWSSIAAIRRSCSRSRTVTVSRTAAGGPGVESGRRSVSGGAAPLAQAAIQMSGTNPANLRNGLVMSGRGSHHKGALQRYTRGRRHEAAVRAAIRTRREAVGVISGLNVRLAGPAQHPEQHEDEQGDQRDLDGQRQKPEEHGEQHYPHELPRDDAGHAYGGQREQGSEHVSGSCEGAPPRPYGAGPGRFPRSRRAAGGQRSLG